MSKQNNYYVRFKDHYGKIIIAKSEDSLKFYLKANHYDLEEIERIKQVSNKVSYRINRLIKYREEQYWERLKNRTPEEKRRDEIELQKTLRLFRSFIPDDYYIYRDVLREGKF